MSALLAESMFVLFAILAIGAWLGQISYRGIALGGAAVFFVGLFFGHFGYTIPRPIMELGLLLFVYSIGLQAGPRFFRTFRRQGRQFVAVAVAVVGVAGAVTVLVARAMDLPYALAVGMFTGAVTNTPALAGAVDAVGSYDPLQAPTVSVGYGIAYPFSIIGVTLLMQFIPGILHRSPADAEAEWRESQRREQPALEKRQYRVTNPNLDGVRLGDLDTHSISKVNISRVKHGETVSAGTADVVVHLADVLLAVGVPEELDKLRLLVGEPAEVSMEAGASAVSRDLEVTEANLAGKRLMDLEVLERYGVVITRLRRQGIEIAPVGTSTLELGDSIRVVGDQGAVDGFVTLVAGDARRLAETNMVPFLAGLALGVAVGQIAVPLPSGLSVKLGAAGGAFLVSLLLGHFGRIGPFRIYVPVAARNLIRELGLMLFLAGAGANAGTQLVKVVSERGIGIFAAAAAITLSAVAVSLLMTHVLYRMNLLVTEGALAGSMTNPPALGAAAQQTTTDVPAVTYATIFPVALIFKILLAQILVQIMRVR
jgi:putative transport protein